MRALKQEPSQATAGSWSSWPGVSPSLIFATIFVPSPPFWGVPASSAPSGGLTPNPQDPAPGKTHGGPLWVWLSRPGEEGGRRRRDASAALRGPRRVLAWFLPCSILAQRHPGT